MLRIAPLDAPISLEFFVSHGSVVLVAHLVFALLFAGRLGNRLWAATAFTFPVAMATLSATYASFGATWSAGIAALIGLAVLAWSLIPALRGAPIVAAATGSLVASEAVRFRHEELAGDAVGGSDLAILGLWLLGGLLTALFAGRAYPGIRFPKAPASWIVGAAGVILGLFLVAFDGAPSPAPPLPGSARAGPPPVVLIVLDTVRADRLDLYGYERATMPALSQFARTRAVTVRNAYANGGWSLPTHASLFTGLHPPRHGAHAPFQDDPDKPRTGGYRLADSIPTLAELLGRAGYWTVGVSANFAPLSDLFGLDRGFQRYNASPDATQALLARSPWRIPQLAFSPAAPVGAFLDRLPPFSSSEFFLGVRYRRAREITDEALEAVETAGQQPFFLFVNYVDAHQALYPPREYRDRFPGVRWQLGLHGLDKGVQSAVLRGDRSLSLEESEHLRALYDGELAYLDDQLGRFLEGLARHPKWSEMLVVITSDHGEALGEHGSIGHGTSLYEEMIRIPLVIKPGHRGGPVPQGDQISGPLESVDVFATILDHAGVGTPARTDGLPWGRGRTHVRA